MTDERKKAYFEGAFAGLCSTAEFAEIVGLKDDSAIRHAIKTGRLVAGTDCLKLGKQWVLSLNALNEWCGGLRPYSEAKADWLKSQAEKITTP